MVSERVTDVKQEANCNEATVPARRPAGAMGVVAWGLALAGLIVLMARPASAQIPVTAAWDGAIDGLTAGYRVSVGTTPRVPLARLDVGAATSIVLPLPPGAVYCVSVNGYTPDGLEGPPSEEIAVDLANAPGTPTGLRASVNGDVATVAWAPPASGGVPLTYLLSVGTAPGAANVLAEYPVGTLLSVGGAVPPGTYYARVQAANSVGVSAPAQDVTFQVGAAVAAPSLSASWSGSTVTLRWTGGAATYVLDVGTAPGAANLGSFPLGGVTSFSAAVPPGTFYVRVRAVSATGVASAPSNELTLRGR